MQIQIWKNTQEYILLMELFGQEISCHVSYTECFKMSNAEES